MGALGTVQQVAERQIEQGANFVTRPVVADGGHRQTPEGEKRHDAAGGAGVRIAASRPVST
jgi:hypothetical protein